jgi:hypothetical protein
MSDKIDTDATTPPAADLPLGHVAALFGSNHGGGEAFAVATVLTTVAAASAASARKQPPRPATSAPAQLSVEYNIAPTPTAVPPSHNQSPNIDLATVAVEDLTTMHDLFSNDIAGGRAVQYGTRAVYMPTTGTATMPVAPTTTAAIAIAGTSALPIPVVAFLDLAHAWLEESPRKESANGPAVQEVMSPDGGRNTLDDGDDDEDEDDDDDDDEEGSAFTALRMEHFLTPTRCLPIAPPGYTKVQLAVSIKSFLNHSWDWSDLRAFFAGDVGELGEIIVSSDN